MVVIKFLILAYQNCASKMGIYYSEISPKFQSSYKRNQLSVEGKKLSINCQMYQNRYKLRIGLKNIRMS